MGTLEMREREKERKKMKTTKSEIDIHEKYIDNNNNSGTSAVTKCK